MIDLPFIPINENHRAARRAVADARAAYDIARRNRQRSSHLHRKWVMAKAKLAAMDREAFSFKRRDAA